ncbi:MAG: hypothetical protein C3F12_10635 [Candidatus Methylomirabilota bacterium]|nr:hypothetical protein [candidate division NC10 bacterium]PWB44838.1 MAG: hypothetical protein C3F12_10635 [candidate division NC10 bacterium]
MHVAATLRQGVALLLCLLLIVGSTFGCAAIEEQVKAHPETALGAGIGTAAGMLTGGLIFGNAAGTLVGGLIGGLTGGIIGNVIEARSYDRTTTSQRYNYKPTQGTILRIEAVEVHPAQIRPGDTINLNMRFAVLAPNAQQAVQVSERRQILLNSSTVGDSTLQVQRMGGTWTSSQPLTLPANAASGSYRVIMTVKADGVEATQQTTFTVIR